jgi:hypothetical protein
MTSRLEFLEKIHAVQNLSKLCQETIDNAVNNATADTTLVPVESLAAIAAVLAIQSGLIANFAEQLETVMDKIEEKLKK